MAAAALRLTFGPPPPEPPGPYETLPEDAQRAVRVLAGMSEPTWQWVNFTEILTAWSLPSERDALRGYAGLR
ncbi:hypothetical protein ACFQHO_14630 [Actinomadura yumaensis]